LGGGRGGLDADDPSLKTLRVEKREFGLDLGVVLLIVCGRYV
jgi:hypothetical protein